MTLTFDAGVSDGHCVRGSSLSKLVVVVVVHVFSLSSAAPRGALPGLLRLSENTHARRVIGEVHKGEKAGLMVEIVVVVGGALRDVPAASQYWPASRRVNGADGGFEIFSVGTRVSGSAKIKADGSVSMKAAAMSTSRSWQCRDHDLLTHTLDRRMQSPKLLLRRRNRQLLF